MRKAVFLFSILVAFISNAQEFPIDLETSKIVYTEVVKTDSTLKKEALFKLAQQLCSTTDNIKINSVDDCIFEYITQITVKYPSNIQGMNHSGTVEYTTNVTCRDGRYKYVITNFVHTSVKGNGGALENTSPDCGKHILTLAGWNTIKKQVREQMPKTVEMLKKNMQPTIAPVKKDDW